MTISTTTSPAPVLLSADGIGKTYVGEKGAQVEAIGDVSFTVAEGEFVAIVGPSGCGKTTLLRTIAGLLKPSRGEIRFDDKAVRRVPDGFGIVFQEYNRSLFPWLTVRKNVEFGLKDLPRQLRTERAAEALARVHLAGVEDQYPWQLSGGMQQRVAIARALATHPRVLLMDEPFASVDAQTRINLELMTAEISAELGLTTLLITHDIDEAIFLADRVFVLSARPSHVLMEVAVDLPRPRDELATKADPRFLDYRRTVYDAIVHPTTDTTPIATTIPRAEVLT
ncbi:NitT/TauT family transport system ATP-binding protein [Nocardioides alpinus]|uniref:ABC transporter ATP-binding protein n=1 Tax=Nocardioides alpinus TaxID=748909 RepID=A0A1I0Y9S7_9ACTN|nr:ABC transporter ATP-binding protein [Nocardioides alpinus]PKH38989.1 ABC transporter ATP-binding protein [Nocardioides alpinus]SFB09547.1 NitT/TauT family transport system ATP-binding protein [Nocardioides alpinus]